METEQKFLVAFQKSKTDTCISKIATNFLSDVINMMVLVAKFSGRMDSNNRIGDPITKPWESITGNASHRMRRPERIDL